MLLADQVADGAALAGGLVRAVAEVQQGVGGGVVAHLVVEAHQCDVVAGAVGEVLGDNEQRDALDAGAAAGSLGQHQVHDVLGKLVVAAGDPHLGAGDPVGAVPGGHGLGGDIGQRRPRLGFGQAHGP